MYKKRMNTVVSLTIAFTLSIFFEFVIHFGTSSFKE